MLQHASRGHTAQELRLLIESRLARIREDIDLKRRSLLAPPRRTEYTPFFRTTSPAAAPAAPGRTVSLAPSNSYLVFEERPTRALELVRSAAAAYPRIVLVSFHPPELREVPNSKLVLLQVGVPGVGGSASDGSLTPQSIAGRILEATEKPGGALVYVDALEVIATGDAIEGMVKFVQWAAGQVARSRSVLVASVAPASFDERVKSLLQRSFNVMA